MTAAARTKVARQPRARPRAAPSGTPTARATALPVNTAAVALPTWSGRTRRAAYPAVIDQNTPWHTPPSALAARSAAKVGAAAAAALETA